MSCELNNIIIMSLFIIRNKLSLRNLFKILLVSTMIYQLIDLTFEYRQYKTIIKSDLKYFESGDLPSVTLCRKDHDWRFKEKSKKDDELKTILYRFSYGNVDINRNHN